MTAHPQRILTTYEFKFNVQAAERAVAESNREIGGYPVAAINIPTDRLTHYGLRQVCCCDIRSHQTICMSYEQCCLATKCHQILLSAPC